MNRSNKHLSIQKGKKKRPNKQKHVQKKKRQNKRFFIPGRLFRDRVSAYIPENKTECKHN